MKTALTMTTLQVAVAFGVTPQSIRNWVAAGTFPKPLAMCKRRFVTKEIEAFLDGAPRTVFAGNADRINAKKQALASAAA